MVSDSLICCLKKTKKKLQIKIHCQNLRAFIQTDIHIHSNFKKVFFIKKNRIFYYYSVKITVNLGDSKNLLNIVSFFTDFLSDLPEKKSQPEILAVPIAQKVLKRTFFCFWIFSKKKCCSSFFFSVLNLVFKLLLFKKHNCIYKLRQITNRYA